MVGFRGSKQFCLLSACSLMCVAGTIVYLSTAYSHPQLILSRWKKINPPGERRTFVSRRKDKTELLTDSCARNRNITKSLTIPPYYPKHGTGSIVTTQLPAQFSKVNELCHASPSLEAIVPVYSAYGNYDRRMAIRNTIGQMCERYKCKLVFIVGFPEDGRITLELKEEYDTYVDIIIINRVDTYRDLNDKAVAMLDWIIEYCSMAKYVIHFVDDTFVNIKLYLEDLPHIGEAIYGYIAHNLGPHRARDSKYYVSNEEYPYAVFPDFVNGVSYGFPTSLAKSLRCAVHDAIYVWLEDVWFMGHVRVQAGIKAAHTKRKEQRVGSSDMKDVDKYLFIHSVEVHDFYKLYQTLSSLNTSKHNI